MSSNTSDTQIYQNIIKKSVKIVIPEENFDESKIEDESYMIKIIDKACDKTINVSEHNFLFVLASLYVLFSSGYSHTVDKTIDRIIDKGTPIFVSIKKAKTVRRLVKYFPYFIKYGFKAQDFVSVGVRRWVLLGDHLDDIIADDLLNFSIIIADVFLGIYNNKKWSKLPVKDKKSHITEKYNDIEKASKFGVAFMEALKLGRNKALGKLVSDRQEELKNEKKDYQSKLEELAKEESQIENLTKANGVIGEFEIDSIQQPTLKYQKLCEGASGLMAVDDGKGGAQRITKALSKQVVSAKLDLAVYYFMIRRAYGQHVLNGMQQVHRDVILKVNDANIGLIDCENGVQLLTNIEGQLDNIVKNNKIDFSFGNQKAPIIDLNNGKKAINLDESGDGASNNDEDERKLGEKPSTEVIPPPQVVQVSISQKYNLSLDYSCIKYDMENLFKDLSETARKNIKKLLKRQVYKTEGATDKDKVITDNFRHKFFKNEHQTLKLYQIYQKIEKTYKDKKWI